MKKAIVTILAMLMLIASISAEVNVRLAGHKGTMYTLSELCSGTDFTYENLDDWLEDMKADNKRVLHLTDDLKVYSIEHGEAMIELVEDNPDKILVTVYQDVVDLLVYHNGEFHFFRIYSPEETQL